MKTSPLPLYEYAPEKARSGQPVVHIAHANGFPPQVYAEMVALLHTGYRVVALPARPLWEPVPPVDSFENWETMADDLIDGLETHHLAPVIGIGHSMGGTVSLIAARKRPDLFKALILLDPVLFPRYVIWLLTGGPSWWPKPVIPLVKKTLRRRRQWQSSQDAFDRFHGRSIFERWSDQAVWAYIEGLTRPVENSSGGIELRYTPEWEARIYQTAPISGKGWWKWLKQVQVPVLALQGAQTDTFVDGSVRLWKNARPDWPVIRLPEVGHLFPIDHPGLTAQHIQDYLAM